MCGIAGVVDGRGDDAPDAAPLVANMCAAMRHRGPDDLQVATCGAATLGIARLAIVDPAHGRQPISVAGGNITVVANGEIFNAVELRAELGARGHRFTSNSDIEVIAHLYEDDGIGCLDRLNGMFAVAIADRRSGQLHLARDRVGIKPLYWTSSGDRLRFASELTALLLDRTVPREVDAEGMAEMLVLSHLPAPRTPLRAVRQLEPGTVLSWRRGRIRVKRWWRWPTPQPAPSTDVPELHARIRELIVDAVRLQLRADVPVGVLLSGGVDSTALLWAARELGANVPAWCVDFAEPDGDTGYARLAARLLGGPLEERRIAAVDATRELPAMAARLAQPLGDPAVLPSLSICAAAADQVTVLLSGTGADELWGGYGRYVLAGDPDPDSVYVQELSVHDEPAVRAALGLGPGRPVEQRLRDALRAGGGSDPAAARMYLDGTLSLPAALLPLLDTTTMASSIEGRVPLLDHRLVELAAVLPGSARLPGGALKGLFREALRGRVPDAILDRPKRGFNPPLADWTAAALTRSARRLLKAPGGLGDVLDADRALSWLQPDAASPGLRALRTWVLLVTDLWWRQVLAPAEHRLSGDLAQITRAVS